MRQAQPAASVARATVAVLLPGVGSGVAECTLAETTTALFGVLRTRRRLMTGALSTAKSARMQTTEVTRLWQVQVGALTTSAVAAGGRSRMSSTPAALLLPAFLTWTLI